MQLYYSGGTRAFYALEIHGGEGIPTDAVQITAEEHLALLTAEAEGFEIIADADGRPVAMPRQPAEATPPAPIRVITAREFRLRFSMAERGAITLAASQALEQGEPALQVFLDDLAASQVVELDHPELAAGVQALVSAGLISATRAAEILAQAP